MTRESYLCENSGFKRPDHLDDRKARLCLTCQEAYISNQCISRISRSVLFIHSKSDESGVYLHSATALMKCFTFVLSPL